MEFKKIVFLDRDGVINQDTNYPYIKEDIIFIDGVFESLKIIAKRGYEFIIITNQSGIGRGYFSYDQFFSLNSWMLNEFKLRDINILDVFFCPHSPEERCACRKPNPGLFQQATEKYPIDLKKSWMIGDKRSDIIAANRAGIKQTILVTLKQKDQLKGLHYAHMVSSVKEITGCIV